MKYCFIAGPDKEAIMEASAKEIQELHNVVMFSQE